VTDPTDLSILHVAAPGAIGGLERVLHDLAIGHHQRGHEVHVAALIGGGGDYGPVLDPLHEAGVPTHVLSIRPHTVLRERSFIRSICDKHKIRIVHTHGYRPDIVDAGVARRMGLATVSTEHGMSKMGGRTRIYEWLQMRLFRKFDAVVAVSQPIAKVLERSGVDPSRIHVIPNAWGGAVDFLDRAEARAALQLAPDGPVIGWVGRLIRAKGADVFLRALAEIRDIPFHAALIGDGPERAALERLSAELGLAASVRFYGAIPDARRCFRAFDVFALSSRTEGTPIVLFEAMAAAVPVVATAVGGVPDVVTLTESILTPPDDARSLANALKHALRNLEDANHRARKALQWLQEEYAIEH
jgi:glycosyltransferase involved in cell wall biosynthesis